MCDVTTTDFLDMTLREISDYLEDMEYESAVLDGTGKYGNRMRLRVTLKPIGDNDEE
jgi:hypothetical protein